MSHLSSVFICFNMTSANCLYIKNVFDMKMETSFTTARYIYTYNNWDGKRGDCSWRMLHLKNSLVSCGLKWKIKLFIIFTCLLYAAALLLDKNLLNRATDRPYIAVKLRNTYAVTEVQKECFQARCCSVWHTVQTFNN